MSVEQEVGDPVSTPIRNRTRTFWTMGTIAIILGGLATFFLVTGRKGGILEQARLRQEQEPYEALQLLERAIADANGTYPDAQVMKCKLLGALQGWRSAERYYDTIDSPGASDQELLLELAAAANHSHAAWLAAKVLGAANHPGPQKEAVVRLLMSVKYDLGEKRTVLQLCEELARLAPNDPEPWLVSAGIHHEIEQFSVALSAYKEALERSIPEQESLRVRFQVAEVSLHLGDLETAEQQIKILRDLDRTAPPVRLTYAKLLRRQGQDGRAKDIVEKIVAQEPQFPGARLLRGQLRYEEGDFRAAAADFLAVIEINPFDYQAHYKLGQVYQRLKMTEESEHHLAEHRRLTNAVSRILVIGRQLDQNPTSRELRLELAEQHLILGDSRSAEHWRRTADRTH